MEPYIVRPLPFNDIDWVMHIDLLGEANRALATYDGILRGIVNQDILLSPLTAQEAVISSKIEGTTVTLEDVLEYQGDVKTDFDANQTQDIIEIENYRKALNRAVELVRYRPLTIETILELHSMLLEGARGRGKNPGKIRTKQNYIGHKGGTIESAIFIPPKPEDVEPALKNWELYLGMTEKDPLVQLALLKAQFELIHPFLDGNGRIGRILVPLILYYKHIISSPLFYISQYFEEHQLQYYTRLTALSKENDWNGWISFFLTATSEQAEENCRKATEMLNLYNVMKVTITETLHSKYSIQVLDFLFSCPIFTSSKFIHDTGIPRQSAINVLNQLERNGIIVFHQKGRGSIPSSYRFERLLEIP